MKYEQKGAPEIFETVEEWIKVRDKQHRHLMDYILTALGLLFVVLVLFAFSFLPRPPDKFLEVAIVALGGACISIGITGALEVKFRGSNITAQGTLGFGVFVFIMAAGGVWISSGCSP